MTLSHETLKEFGIETAPVLLPGGEGRTYRAGNTIVKHINNDSREYTLWIADLCNSITEHGFRIAKPVPTRHDTWITNDGWSAWTFLEGTHEYREHIPESIAAINAFHDALKDHPKPEFLNRTDDSPYSNADRAAWGDKPAHIHPDVKHDVDLLYSLRKPIEGYRDQIIHGDLNPDNMLMSPDLPPAIIDIAPYWRPPEFALAIYAYWIGPWRNDPDVLKYFKHIPNFDQMLVRAAIRILLIMSEFNSVHEMDTYSRATEIIEEWTNSS